MGEGRLGRKVGKVDISSLGLSSHKSARSGILNPDGQNQSVIPDIIRQSIANFGTCVEPSPGNKTRESG